MLMPSSGCRLSAKHLLSNYLAKNTRQSPTISLSERALKRNSAPKLLAEDSRQDEQGKLQRLLRSSVVILAWTLASILVHRPSQQCREIMSARLPHTNLPVDRINTLPNNTPRLCLRPTFRLQEDLPKTIRAQHGSPASRVTVRVTRSRTTRRHPWDKFLKASSEVQVQDRAWAWAWVWGAGDVLVHPHQAVDLLAVDPFWQLSAEAVATAHVLAKFAARASSAPKLAARVTAAAADTSGSAGGHEVPVVRRNGIPEQRKGRREGLHHHVFLVGRFSPLDIIPAALVRSEHSMDYCDGACSARLIRSSC